MNTDGESRFKKCGALVPVFFILAAIMVFGASAGAVEKAVTTVGPPMRSGSEIDYPPFCIVDADGRANGFSVELLRAALRAMGRDVTFRIGPWAQVKGWLEQGEVQALPLVGRTPERESIFDFTFPYISLHGAIVVRKGANDIRNLSDLKGRQVAVMKGDNAEEFLRREDRGIEIHTTATFQEALRELSEGRYDAVVAQRLVALRLIEETRLPNLRVVNQPIEGFGQDFCFAVKEGDRDTLALLNEGLALVMADGTYRRLYAKWFAALQLPAHRRIVIGGDHNYPPFEYLDENARAAGYNVELTRAIARAVGLDIEIRLGPWTEIIRGLESGEIDALQGMFYSPERDLKFDFTQAHTVNHCVSVVRKGDGPPPGAVADLAGKRIVVQQGDIMHDFVVENGLGKQVSAVDAQEIALKELADGKHDCALVSRLTALYWIKKQGWDNLIVGRHPFLSPEYCYAVPNNHKALLAELGEGLKVLEESGEYRRIHKKWMGVYGEEPPSVAAIIRYLAMVAIPLLLLLLVFFLWSWSLRKQVAKRTAELTAVSHRHQAILAAVPDIVMEVDSNKIYTWANQAGLNFFGDDVIGNQAAGYFVGEQDTYETVKPLFDGGEGVIYVESWQRRKDGQKRFLAWWCRVLKDKSGKVSGALSTARDITEFKRAEAALRESEEKYKSILDNIQDGYYEVDLAGNFTFLNRSMCRILGYSSTELLTMNNREYMDKENARKVFETFNRVFTTGEPARALDWELLNKKGTKCYVDTSVSLIRDGNGNGTGFRGVSRDVTEQRNAEKEKTRMAEQLLQAQKMESVGRLAGGVAHDFNNMLSVILGHTEMALDQVDPAQPLHADLQEVLSAARRSRDITRQLLAFARKQTVAPKVLDLNETVEGMLKMLRQLIGEDIDLAWRPKAGLWPIKMDPSQIDQILVNLCVNARDAIAGVGKVTIETDKATFDEAYCADHAGFIPGEFALVVVSDSGHGIDKEILDNIFEPFFTTKGMGRGTGLGLATVYGIVKQNNGFINVYSEPGKGTTIKIYLPRHAGEAEEIGAEGAEEILKGRGETMLLVEDDPAIMKMGKMMLKKLGYQVLAASTPGEAMRLAEEHAGGIHLLITDVVMPEMNGRDLAERLHSLYPELKALFMSGYTADVIEHHGVLDKGVHFMQKPFSMRDLARKVREALGRSDE